MFRMIQRMFINQNSRLRSAIAERLASICYWSFLWDALLNFISPLKLYCPPGTIQGISRIRLRWQFSGKLRIKPGNVIKFQDVEAVSRRNPLPVDVRLLGVGNRLVFKGKLNSMPHQLIVTGKDNLIDIGSNFRCSAHNLSWYLSGNANAIRIGSDVKMEHNPMHSDGLQFIRMTGENCSVSVGDRTRAMLLIEAEPGSPRNFSLNIGSDSAIARLYVVMASSCKMEIGEGFFCSWDCYFWCSAHALLDKEGELLNDCKTISIGKNVWFGHGIEVPGEIRVADGCIIGSGVTLVNNVPKPGSIVTVAPAKVYPVNVKWVRESPVMVQNGMSWRF